MAVRQVTSRIRWLLPHWEEPGSTYFGTFRLADSLPSEILRQPEFERRDIVSTAKHRQLSVYERSRLTELFNEKVQSQLDAGAGACFLTNPKVAELIMQSLRNFDGSRYRLYAWCVMPNHVHVVFRPQGTHTLAEILHTWKSYSAKEANRTLGRSGTFWQREYYDHLIRGEKEFFQIVNYVLENPRVAGLRDWKWVGAMQRE
jgi:REP element-mobilizing transposase RayT